MDEDNDARIRRAKRTAWLIGAIVAAVYIGFVAWTLVSVGS